MLDPPIRVEVDRSGGFAGRTKHATVDSASLPAEQARELAELVERADLPTLVERTAAEPPGPGRGADRFTYDLTVHRGDQSHRLSLPESAVPPELAPLLSHVLAHSRPRRTGGASAGD